MSIHPSAQIGPNVVIEPGVYIGPLCVIGYPPEWKGRNTNHGVIIKKGAMLMGMVCVDGGADKPTIIGENCYLMKGSYVAHDCELEEGVTISSGVRIGGHCKIGAKTNIGMNAVIHQRVEVPEGCMIGAGGFVGKKSVLKPKHKYAGVPVKELGENK